MLHHKTGARLPFTASVTQRVPLLPLSELIILYSVDILTNLGTPVSKILCNYLRYCLKNGQQCFIGFKNTRRSRVFLDTIKHMLPNPCRNFRFTLCFQDVLRLSFCCFTNALCFRKKVIRVLGLVASLLE